MPQQPRRTRLWTHSLQVLCIVALAACGKGAEGPKGAPGAPGAPGANGTSCSAQSNNDGTTTITCTDGTSGTVSDGAPGAPGTSCTVTDNGNGTRTITCGASGITVSDAVVNFGLLSAAEQADANPSAVVTAVTFPADGRPVVTLKVSDRKGNGIKGIPAVSPVSWRFALLKLVPGSETALGVNGSSLDTWVSYIANNATSTASTESPGTTATSGTLTDNNDGTYTYRFAKVITNAAAAGTAFEADKVHRLVVLLYASSNPFQPINIAKDFIPSTGADVSGQNDKVDPAACLQCHGKFRAAAGGTGAFHSGTRYNVQVCVACHNDQRRFTAVPGTGTTPNANDDSIGADGKWTGNMAVLNGEAVINFPVFVHKIHMGEDLSLNGGTYQAVQFPEITYPQDARNCTKCHRAPAAKADNWMNKPSRRACNACHDNVSFERTIPPGRISHTGGAWGDDKCTVCHGASMIDGTNEVANWHVAVAPPDPNSTWAGGTNSNTNAAYLAAANALPKGASRFVSVVKSVARDTSKHPVIVFKLQKDGADVVFNSFGAKTELIDNFVGSPTLYFAWAIPQDGIQTPADFNMSASGYLKRIWNGTATGSGAGTLSGPDATGFYTLTLTGVTVTDTATMLTGGVGYAYSLGNGTAAATVNSTNQPLTQTNLPAYPVKADGTGGLIVPTPDVWVVGTGYTGRRTLVATSKCNACHEALGAAPTFHAGQRNDAPTCSFCHKPNQTSSGWSAASSSYIHAIHGGSKRVNAFNWHASTPGKTYAEVTFPGVLNNCETCHVPGGYDFSATPQLSAYSNMLYSTVGQGRYNSSPTTNPNGWYSISPFVVSDNQTDYGYGFATSNVSATLPDGISGTQTIGGNTVACTPSAPCICNAANPCSVDISATYTVNNVAVSFTQKIGAVTNACNATTPCTCTTAQPCTGIVAACSAAAPCNAQPTTLVSSPIVAACTGCHDSPMAIDHMQANGGSFYEPRGTAFTKPQKEQCLLCHADGKLASIRDVHMK
jgi:OmcA/MtrC family decaheme c-type cytochrome